MLVIFPSKSPLVPVASVGCANTASLGVWLPKLSPDAARNATGATFAWGPFRPLDFSGPRTPPEFGPPPEDHSQLVCGYRLLMGRRYSPRNSRVQAPSWVPWGVLVRAGPCGTLLSYDEYCVAAMACRWGRCVFVRVSRLIRHRGDSSTNSRVAAMRRADSTGRKFTTNNYDSPSPSSGMPGMVLPLGTPNNLRIAG